MISVGKGSGRGAQRKFLHRHFFFLSGALGGSKRPRGANCQGYRGQTVKRTGGKRPRGRRGKLANSQGEQEQTAKEGGGRKYSLQRGQKIYPTEAMQSKTTHFNVSK